MRAIVVHGPGGPEALRFEQHEQPSAAPGQLLVETAAIGVNFIETYQRSGVYKVDYPFVPGSEAAGVVLEVGEGVTGFAVGDRIATSGATATYAEMFVVAAEQVARVPEKVDLETAAALPLQGCTAHYLANSVASPQPGDTVLVHAGAGGVGLLLTQLLATRGVRVFTTASTDEKRALSLEAGGPQRCSATSGSRSAHETSPAARACRWSTTGSAKTRSTTRFARSECVASWCCSAGRVAKCPRLTCSG